MEFTTWPVIERLSTNQRATPPFPPCRSMGSSMIRLYQSDQRINNGGHLQWILGYIRLIVCHLLVRNVSGKYTLQSWKFPIESSVTQSKILSEKSELKLWTTLINIAEQHNWTINQKLCADLSENLVLARAPEIANDMLFKHCSFRLVPWFMGITIDFIGRW